MGLLWKISCALLVPLIVGIALQSALIDVDVSQYDWLIFHSERFHGHGINSAFFEGWYIKMVTKDEKHSLVVIPGIFFGNSSESKENHAFVMVIVDGKNSHQYKYPTQSFIAEKDQLKFSIETNTLSEQGLELHLQKQGQVDATANVEGKITYSNLKKWPSTLLSPGVMGWYSYVPTMECFHGVVSMDHDLHGSLVIDGQEIDFEGGKGYIEKDWGHQFPTDWIWVQSNNFLKSPNTSVFISLAKVPWRGFSFPGFLAGFWFRNELHRFATYTGAKFELKKVNETIVEIRVSDSKYALEASIHRTSGPFIYAPRNGKMVKIVMESVSSEMSLKFFSQEQGGTLLWEDIGRQVGLEVQGDIDWLFANL